MNYENKNIKEAEKLNFNIEEISNIDCLILGVKDGIFLLRKVTDNIDWKLVIIYKINHQLSKNKIILLNFLYLISFISFSKNFYSSFPFDIFKSNDDKVSIFFSNFFSIFIIVSLNSLLNLTKSK